MAETRSKRRTAKTIRNLTNKMVHLRLNAKNDEKPYRIELQRRGTPGDWHTVPAALTEDSTFVAGVDYLFEVIPLSEAKAIDYGQTAGYQPRVPVEVIRPDQNTIATAASQDAAIQANPRSPIGPRTVNVPGSDPELNAAYQGGTSAMPEGALTPKVTTERVKG